MRHRVQRIVTAGDDHREIQVGELLGERLGGRQIGLGQAQDRKQSAGVRRDQCPVDQPGARRRVGQRHHDQQLIGVGDDYPLGGIGVIGGAPQQCSPRAAPHDAGQRIGATRQIADDVDVVADDDRCATQFPCPHRGHVAVDVAAEHTPPAAAVDADHHRLLRVGVLRAGFGPRARTLPGPEFDVGLVVVAGPQPTAPRACRPTFEGNSAGSWRWSRCRPPRRRRPAVRRSRRPSPSGDRHRTARCPACSGVAVISRPSGVSRQSPPSRLISVDSAARRSVSWPRRCAMPDSRETEPGAASAASTATDGVSSPTSRRLTSNPE